jgi:hypothetical protein
VACALKAVLKQDPKLKAEFERVAKALKQEDEQDAEDEARLVRSIDAGLAELAELSQHHFR